MPFEHSIDHKHRLLVIRGFGSGSLEETEDSVARAVHTITERAVLPGYGVLINVDAIDLVPTAEQTLRIAQLIALLHGHLRGHIAIVTSAIGKVTAAHLMAVHSSGPNEAVKAFTDESTAHAWLMARGAPIKVATPDLEPAGADHGM